MPVVERVFTARAPNASAAALLTCMAASAWLADLADYGRYAPNVIRRAEEIQTFSRSNAASPLYLCTLTLQVELPDCDTGSGEFAARVHTEQ